jgi:hypothetical protein
MLRLALTLMGLLLFPAQLTSTEAVAEEKNKALGALSLTWVGDGKSFDTAISFKSPRSESEYILLEHVYLREIGQNTLVQSLIIKDGKQFDVYETEGGKIYFLLPTIYELN